jgi:four helix bundle protein
VRDFRDMKVWARGHRLVLSVYQATQEFPKEERYGLASQMRRSASSIPANIAEGCGRVGDAEFARFCQLSFGSANELEYWLLLAKDLDYLTVDQYQDLLAKTTEVKRMLGAFLSTLRGRTKHPIAAR